MSQTTLAQKISERRLRRLRLRAALITGALMAISSGRPVLAAPAGTVQADTWVNKTSAAKNYGTTKSLQVDATPTSIAYFRIQVSGLGAGMPAASARLRLGVSTASGSGSDSGGSLYRIAGCSWGESTITWKNRPAIDGTLLGTVGTVALGGVADFDITAAISGDGVYCFALQSASDNGVRYYSREAATGRPEVTVVAGGATSTTSTTALPTTTTTTAAQTTTTLTGGTTTTTLAPPTTTTTLPAPRCGDGIVNQPAEQCDGVPATACPGACLSDCTCGTLIQGAIEADVTVSAGTPTTNLGTSSELWADANVAKSFFLRARVSGVGTRTIAQAVLRLRVVSASDAGSDSGGRLHRITSCTWDELATTWSTQPAIDGPTLAQQGAVTKGATVDFDVTAAMSGDGLHCFAVESPSSDGVTYNSREATTGRPELRILTRPATGGSTTTTLAPTTTTTTTATLPTTTTTLPATTTTTAPPATTTTAAPTTTTTVVAATTTTAPPATTTTTTTTTIPAPRCGDGILNQASEQCDGTDAVACPDACLADCTCGSIDLIGLVAADVYINQALPTQNFGASPELWVDRDVGKQTFLRVSVNGIGERPITRAVIRLRVDGASNAGSDSGGRIHRVNACSWNELTMTWPNGPAFNGPTLHQIGAVVSGELVTFDVTRAITGDGAYCFGIESPSTDGVLYKSREAGTGHPEFIVTVDPPPPPVCGDDMINRGGEHCDGTDDDACPGLCRANCTCPAGTPVCGDGTVNRAVEECDGTDDATCPGACRMDCTCADTGFCGDGAVNRAAEECDGADDTTCPGQCEIDCTCPAPPACGDNNINQTAEECDGTDAPTCPGACLANCTCAPAACGDHHVNQGAEDCDGPDDAACPGRCLADCTCDTTLAVGVIEADVATFERDPNQNFGRTPAIGADLTSAQLTYLRARVRGVGAQSVLRATLLLHVLDDSSAASDSGGRLHWISDCSWNELAMTYITRPAIDGPMLAEAAHAVRAGDTVAFDVTGAINADGTYCFALDSLSADGVQYGAREALVARPILDVVAGGICGDGRVNQPSEACDATDDALCPAACLDDCTCAVCGDGIAEPLAEVCDGADDGLCAGRCAIDCTCPDLPLPPFACLAQGGADITLHGVLLDAYRNDALAAATKIDARDAAIVAFPDSAHPINLGGGPNGCLAGGTILGQYDRTLSWDVMHDFNNAGVAFTNPFFTVDGVRVDNMTDGIRPRDGSSFTLRSAWLSYVRDDCIENDHLEGGLVDDSLFDGCYVAFSARPSPEKIDAGVDGSGNVWTIQNSLVRLEAMPGPDGGAPTDLGHGGFFKWHSWNDPSISLSPKLALYNNVFMAEQVGEVGGSRMGTPPDQVVDCANNTMVWLGSGPFPGTLPSCFTVTTNRAVWDAAVADWHARHPYVGW